MGADMANIFDDVPSLEPKSFRAGDLVEWRKPFADYPAASYRIEYVIAPETDASQRVTVMADAEPDGQRVSLASSQTSGLNPGIHHWTCFVVRIADEARRTLAQGRFEVLPNLAVASGDQRSHAERMVDQLQALIEGRALSDAASYEIAGRKITKLSPDDLTKWLAHYRRELRLETNRRNGRSARKLHRIRFT